MSYKAAIHTIPLNDDDIHFASAECPCSPFCDDSADINVYVHHAFDGREASERAGRPVKGKGWTSVGELINDG